ncbi:spore coat protein [Moorella thermoacetica Y72]|uniref:Spore coat protein n=1 Tax=Moorella thermoacetica Y72 TaxID=1325331 RepID=A0A0S6U9R7_NEOTH|nr:spore coat protein [Moorella thermoacetica]GAF24925.1 spore coat protein [Moorella thermoacetica Y72]
MPIQGFDDKSIFSDCLASEKLLTSCYNTAITECANDQLRRDFMAVYQDEQNCLKAVWDVMHARGWYQLNLASQQEISQLQQRMQQEHQRLQQVGMAGGAFMGQPQIGGIPQYRI